MFKTLFQDAEETAVSKTLLCLMELTSWLIYTSHFKHISGQYALNDW